MNLEQLSGAAKTAWGLITIVVSAITAIASAAIYVHDLQQNVDNLSQQVKDLTKQVGAVPQNLKVKGDAPPPGGLAADFNGRSTAMCNSGSFIVGLRISVDDHFNSSGTIFCSKAGIE